MNRRSNLIIATFSLTFSASIAVADWNPGDPYKMHYPQLPDLTPTGMDILASPQPAGTAGLVKILADDWRCTETGPVNDIHIWGSWLDDRLPQDTTGAPNPGAVNFKLSIHEDIPSDPATGTPSHPGLELWSKVFHPGEFTPRVYGQGPESFYDPNTKQIIGSDTIVWQYNFTHIVDPLVQKEGTVYWLDVQALPASASFFGWKTTNPQITQHFLDDSVYGDTDVFGGPLIAPPGWTPMTYPDGHQYAGLSTDQAFVITPEPTSLGLVALAVSTLVLRRRSRAI